jgi:hypothetical protein
VQIGLDGNALFDDRRIPHTALCSNGVEIIGTYPLSGEMPRR